MFSPLRKKSKGLSDAFELRLFSSMMLFIGLVLAAWPALSQECPPPKSGFTPPSPDLQDSFNPKPLEGDIALPMPCGGKLILRPVRIPADGYFEDLQLDLGCEDCGRRKLGFMEGKRKGVISGPFTHRDLPEPWRRQLTLLEERGDNRSPKPGHKTGKGFYFFIGKYEVSNFQWKAIMDGKCPGPEEPLGPDGARPKTGISWFDAVEFTRLYTEWLLKNNPESLPRFSHGRFGYLRLPTEDEWEYAARGGHRVGESQLNQEEFFPLKDRTLSDYAVFTGGEEAMPPEKPAWIGSKCPNPLGLFDTAGNAAEMVLEPFRFSVGNRLHGTAGGFVAKGGSYRKRKEEIMPGRREEMPFFLEGGAFRSTDLGFRILLSGILTPDDRGEALKNQWATANAKGQQTERKSASPAPVPEIDQNKDPISEIDRLATTAHSDSGRRNLIFLRDVIKQKNLMLKKQLAETFKADIWGAILTAETVSKYLMQRKLIQRELHGLEKSKMEIVHESVLASLESDRVKANGTLIIYDAAVDYFLQSYLNRIKDGQKYPDAFFESQMVLIFQELSAEEDLKHSLKLRLELFKKHVSLQRGRAENMDRETLMKEIISTYAR